MEIRLKQKDIEAAITMYLASQGVARPVSNISFTMGRKDAGLSAEVECAESAPGFEPSVVSVSDSVMPEPKTVNPEPEEVDPQAGYRELEEAANAESEEKPAVNGHSENTFKKSDMSLFTS